MCIRDRDYIETHPAAAIFLDCGLGKTSITLTAIADLLFDSFEVHKVLVIAPLRVARDTWTAETDKWDHLQNLICSVAVGTEAQRRSSVDALIVAGHHLELVRQGDFVVAVEAVDHGKVNACLLYTSRCV